MSRTTSSLVELEDRDRFLKSHIGPDSQDIAAMLKDVGYESLDALVETAIPNTIFDPSALPLPEHKTEAEVLDALQGLAAKNKRLVSLIGMGYHDTFTPPVIQRNVLENPGWYTAYTPYQAEISQGRMEALLNFQQMVMDLTGMELANASLLDEATAAGEAMTFMKRVGKHKSMRCFVSDACHPQTLDVIRTRAKPLGIDLIIGDPDRDLEPGAVYGVILPYPTTTGEVRDWRDTVQQVHAAGGLVTVIADLLSLALLTPPGEWGADVVVGNSQRFGVPMAYGGPHAAFFATHDKYKRSVPGRIIGVSQDQDGRLAFRLALQTREQHIRREKATSNICTAQVLLAVMAGFYAVWHGPEGIRKIAARVHRLTAILASGLQQKGVSVAPGHFFDTLRIKASGDILERARKAGFNLRPLDGDWVGLSLDETTTRAHVFALWDLFCGVGHGLEVASLDATIHEALPPDLLRTSPYLTHPVFNSYRSETEMLRYIRLLMDKDLALDRAMIPLGSCTMKLNATAEMMAISWPEFAGLHPFVPLDQAGGYQDLITGLEDMLCAITGFSAVSLQPNAGSQGEYAGLLAIARYHESRGAVGRDICLIPSSAHGTNPASAVMAGMQVVVVACDENGNIDLADVREKAEAYKDRLAALMVTYPSTHGVFERDIREICRVIHDQGGQVYMDGANLNALVGLGKPGDFGPDVMHINLHKTFCIPHGGGGPGVGPIAVGAHLAKFLPGHGVVTMPGHSEGDKDSGNGAVAAAPWGSAGILPISWAYIALMGANGLKKASEVAILNANYIAQRLCDHFPILYSGKAGLVAHECIIDVRAYKDTAGITVDDIAKRLIDYGFHAPTMSWPVAGTLMIEPTESESRAEIDRFCEAMIAIREEIRAIESGQSDAKDNPLKHAPHTAEDVLTDRWDRSYSREQAVFPVDGLKGHKYWPPVNRVDNAFGDLHFVCSCPSIEAYQQAAE